MVTRTSSHSHVYFENLFVCKSNNTQRCDQVSKLIFIRNITNLDVLIRTRNDICSNFSVGDVKDVPVVK